MKLSITNARDYEARAELAVEVGGVVEPLQKPFDIEIGPHDILLLTTSRALTDEVAERIARQWKGIVHDSEQPLVTLDEGLELAGIIRRSAFVGVETR